MTVGPAKRGERNLLNLLMSVRGRPKREERKRKRISARQKRGGGGPCRKNSSGEKRGEGGTLFNG